MWQRITVLIVDDDPQDRVTFRRLLEGDPDHEFEFAEAALGQDALNMCSVDPPSCILLDYMLPDMDGLQFLSRLAGLTGASLIPVVMLTSHGNEAVATQAIKAGAQDYMVKDVVTAPAIRRAVRNAMQKVSLLRKIEQQHRDLEQVNLKLVMMNRRLEEASRLKSEFLANASHELRTPLNSILGFLHLVLDGMCESRKEETEFIATALRSAESLLDLINVLLDISKIEAGKMVLDLEEVSLAKLFDDAYLMTYLRAQEQGLTLELHPPDDASATVRADYGKLRQVLLNLLSNAIKFTDQGGVTVRARPDAGRGFVAIEVADTGIGVRPEQHKRVFEKFVQGDGSSTRKHGGTGLGLSITKSLVELMGGIITLESPGVGKGTTVTFTVPFYRPQDRQGRPGPQTAEQETRVNGDSNAPLLLIAEDDTLFSDMIEHMAHQAGYATICALTADRAVSLARKHRPAAITLDYALLSADHPSLANGWDAYTVLKTDLTTADIPVIFVSGYEPTVRERWAETPSVEPPRFLMKPFDKYRFLEVLAEVRSEKAGARGAAS